MDASLNKYISHLGSANAGPQCQSQASRNEEGDATTGQMYLSSDYAYRLLM